MSAMVMMMMLLLLLLSGPEHLFSMPHASSN
jgi:hypothetical protein